MSALEKGLQQKRKEAKEARRLSEGHHGNHAGRKLALDAPAAGRRAAEPVQEQDRARDRRERRRRRVRCVQAVVSRNALPLHRQAVRPCVVGRLRPSERPQR